MAKGQNTGEQTEIVVPLLEKIRVKWEKITRLQRLRCLSVPSVESACNKDRRVYLVDRSCSFEQSIHGNIPTVTRQPSSFL